MRHAPPMRLGAPPKGRTLVEILSVLAVLLVLTSTAWPALLELAATQRQEAARAALSAHIAYARAAAISGGWRVALAPLRSTGWSAGWRVYQDRNANGSLDPGETVLIEHTVEGVSVAAGSPRARYVGFEALGHPVQASGAFFAETFSICATRAPQTYRLVISKTGRVKALKIPTPCD